jgi:microcystin-dependent protein
MADPFIGEIRTVGFNFAPRGWALCNGQLLTIAQNTALFSILGTTYGGNGQTNFALPDLQGRAPMHWGQGPGLSLHDLGESSGSETVNLLAAELPSHSHTLSVSSQVGTQASPAGGYLSASAVRTVGYAATADTVLHAGTVAGSATAHNNMQPYVVMNFIIALQGVFPPRT